MDRNTLRQKLLAEQEELTLRIEKIELSRSSRTISKQFDEQSVERDNDEVLAGLDMEARFELKAVETALARIDTDYFDRCTACSEAISDERLNAIPHATTCRHCAE